MTEYSEITLSDMEAEEVLTAPIEEAEPGGNDWMSQPAPYGRFKSGKPRKTPPANGPKVAAPERRAPSKKGGRPDYVVKVTEVLAIPAAVLGLVATVTDSQALLADSATVSLYTPAAAKHMAELAEQKPEFAAVLDKASVGGPYAALIAVVALPMTLQILANHKVIAPVEQLGVRSREDLIASITEQAAP